MKFRQFFGFNSLWLLIGLVLFTTEGFAQYLESTNTHWALGDQIHINTSTNNVLTNALNVDGASPEGTAVWYPPKSVYRYLPSEYQSGTKFYYTNGSTIWEATNTSGNTWSHSTDGSFGGDPSSPQPAVFVPRYNGSTAYNVYGVSGGSIQTDAFGSNAPNVSGLSTGIAVVPSSNPNIMWIITLSSGNGSFKVIERTSNRMQNYFTSGYFTHNVSTQSSGGASGGRSAIIVSPPLGNDQYYIAACIEDYGVMMCSFDAASGTISPMGKVANSTSSYSGAFSPNGNNFFFTNTNSGNSDYRVAQNIYRHAVGSSSSTAIGGSGYSGMGLNPQGIIWVSKNGEGTLGEISSPNSPSASFSTNGLFLEGAQLNYGVPNNGVCYYFQNSTSPGSVTQDFTSGEGTFVPERLYIDYCLADPLPFIDGTPGSGGNGTYIWEYNPQNNFTDDSWFVIDGATGEDYQPTAAEFFDEDGDPVVEVAYRRRLGGVHCGNFVSDIIRLRPYYFEPGELGTDYEFCQGQTIDPVPTSQSPFSGASGATISFQWQYTSSNFESVDQWYDITGATQENYTPTEAEWDFYSNPPEDLFFRRIETSSVCPNDDYLAVGGDHPSFNSDRFTNELLFWNLGNDPDELINGSAVRVTRNDNPTITSVDVNCTSTSAGTVTVNAPGTGNQYKLDNGSFQTSNSFANVSNGSHTVTVRNSGGCEATQSVTVNCSCGAATPSNVSANPSNVCAGQTVTLTGSIASGNTIRWYTNAAGTGTPIGTGNSITVTPSTSTTYYAFGFNNSQSCQSSGSANVAVTVATAPNAPTVTSPVTANCPNNTFQLLSAVTSNAGSNTTLFGTQNNTNNLQTLTSSVQVAPGTYFIFYQNGTGCYSSSAQVNVLDGGCCPNPPVASINSPLVNDQSCGLTAITFEGEFAFANNATWVAVTGNGSFAPTSCANTNCNSTYTPTAAGNHTIRLVTNDPDGSGSCQSASAEYSFIVYENPQITNLNIQNASTPCPNPSNGFVNVNATGSNLQYSIDNVTFTNSSFFGNLTPGNYTVYVRNQAGCSTTEDFTIANDCPAGPSVDAGVDQTICSGNSATLTATPTNTQGTVTYNWQPGDFTTQSITVSPFSTQTYTVTISADNGTASDQVQVIVNNCSENCENGIDDDEDGDTDCNDSDCSNHPNCCEKPLIPGSIQRD